MPRLKSFIATYTGVDEEVAPPAPVDARTALAQKRLRRGLAQIRTRRQAEDLAANRVGDGKVELYDPPLGKRKRRRKGVAEDVPIKIKARKSLGRIIKPRPRKSPEGIAAGLTEQSFVKIEVQDAASGQWLPVGMTQNVQAMISKGLQQAKLVFRDKGVRARDALTGHVIDIMN
jgi:hypothetical protein